MRALRIVLVVAVILGGLFVAADRLAVHLAESEAADRVQSRQGLTGAPDVSIKGFPFLTQVAAKELDEVDLNLDGVTARAGGRSITIAGMTAKLHHVRLGDGYSSATAESATGTAHISYADLSRAADRGVTVTYGGKDTSGMGQVKVTASVQVPVVGSVKRSVVSQVSIVDGDTIRLHAESVPGAQVPGLEGLIRDRIDFDRKIAGLPRGIRLDKVVTTPDGVDVSVTGTDVELAG